MQKRVEQILTDWHSTFDGKPSLIVKSPGRINLLGEHTDYNDGYAMPAAIEQAIYTAIDKTPNAHDCVIHALEKNESFSFSLSNMPSFEIGAWQNYVIGVVQEIIKGGKTLSPFNLMFTGDIPIGAGLSSSAALENGIVFSINQLFKLGLTKHEMILISQKAEHNYAKVQCGIMDQYASMFGEENKVLLLDCMNNTSTLHQLDIQGYELILVASNVTHALASTEYNTRREECEVALEKIGSPSYRGLSQAEIEGKKHLLTEEEYKRSTYLLAENHRVLDAINVLASEEVESFGKLLYESHKGLQHLFEVTCPETDFLVEAAKQNKVVIGARQMGGGFGGCTLNLIEKGQSKLFITAGLKSTYYSNFKRELPYIR